MMLLVVLVAMLFEPPPVVILKGDTNGDGKVNIIDAMMIAQHQVKIITLTPEQLERADTNGDGVNIVDAMRIAQYLVGIIGEL